MQLGIKRGRKQILLLRGINHVITIRFRRALYMVRNKAHNFPNLNGNRFEGEPRAKAEYASRRADGTINTHPQERMRASTNRDSDTSNLLE
jgi:small acid-soluble spore protein K (minor)